MKICKIEDCNRNHWAKGLCHTHYRQQYYKDNREKELKQNVKWMETHKKSYNIYHKQYRKQYYLDNKEYLIEWQKQYYKDNKEICKEQVKQWHKKNPEKVREYYRKWQRQYSKNNPRYRLYHSTTEQIRQALKGRKAGRCWEILIGYTLNDLIKHLEKQFNNEMTWYNYGSYWHIDHIKPKSLFHYATAENDEFKKCWALSNLQPLEASKNREKHNTFLEV